ncbi:hypothetical protein NSTC731_05736 [Nostoc sp. DSM 114167]|jgi:hypothetical protein
MRHNRAMSHLLQKLINQPNFFIYSALYVFILLTLIALCFLLIKRTELRTITLT